MLIDAVLGFYCYVLLFLSFHVKMSAHCTWQDVLYIMNYSNWDRKMAINSCCSVYLRHDFNLYIILFPKYEVHFGMHFKWVMCLSVFRCKVVYSIQLSFDTYRYISVYKYSEHVYTTCTWWETRAKDKRNRAFQTWHEMLRRELKRENLALFLEYSLYWQQC